MATKTIYKSVSVRRSPVPRASRSGSGFFGMLARLAGANEQLQRSRPRKRRV